MSGGDAHELTLLPATELRRRLLARELSAEELLEACLERLESRNPELNAVVTVSAAARDEARAADRRLAAGEEPGLLHGLPVGIKDVTDVAGVRTTFGSTLHAERVARRDALVVGRLRAAGAVILGKTNTPEFAAGAHTTNDVFGPTRNPWDPALSAGGSTGGGAAALASGMVALAEGTDLGGSLRIPASFCGVVGLRPSVGRVPTWPTEHLWDTLQVSGGMARRAGDLALMLRAIAGDSERSPLGSAALGEPAGALAPGELRLGVVVDAPGLGLDPGVEHTFAAAIDTLRGAGATLEAVDLDLRDGRHAFAVLRGLWMVCHHRSRIDRLEDLGENLAGNIRYGQRLGAEEIAVAEAVRGRFWEAFARLFERYDAILTPTVAVPPFPVDEGYPRQIAGTPLRTYVDWFAPTFVLSLTGLPVASVPCGLDARGLPVGMQIVAPPRADLHALAVAACVQELLPVGLPEP